MERIIIQQNKHWQEKYGNLFDREILSKIVKQFKAKEIQILMGVRRSGKSSLFKLLINQLTETINPQTILYVNLDDPFFTAVYGDAKKFYEIVETAEKLTQNKIEYIFLDEIQNVQNWQQFVKSTYDSELFKKILVTGSNSSLLKGEYARLISGRYISDEIFPFSFREILQKESISSYIEVLENKSRVLKLIDLMMEFGSFPEVLKQDDLELKREILINYYDTIVLKDCIANSRIREIKLFQELTHYIISNTSSPFSYLSLAKAVNSNDNSIKEFVRILESSFLIQELWKFSFSLKNQSKARRKAYCVDNGILANVAFRFSPNHGKLFENLVYTELRKRKYNLFFFHDRQECDFIIMEDERFSAIQVCYQLNDQNQDREINGLKQAMSVFEIKEGCIITYNQETEIDGFRIVPFWKYFFEN